MKKIISSVLVLMFCVSLAFAAGPQNAVQQVSSGAPEIVGVGNEESPGQQIQTQVREQISTGTHNIGENIQLQVREQVDNKIQIQVQNSVALTAMNLDQEVAQNQTKLMTQLSNGRNAEIKVMPDTASEVAIQQLRLRVCSEENNCEIELKEVGQGEEVKAAYEVRVEKQARILGLFQTRMQVKAQINAENGELIRTQRPWWSFLATESVEEPEIEEAENQEVQ